MSVVIAVNRKVEMKMQRNLDQLGVSQSNLLAMHLSDIAEELPRLASTLEKLQGDDVEALDGILGEIDASLLHLLNHVAEAQELIDAALNGGPDD